MSTRRSSDTSPSTRRRPERRSVLSLRDSVLILFALLTGAVVAGLTYVSHRRPADAVLTGLTAFGVSFWWYDRFIGSRTR